MVLVDQVVWHQALRERQNIPVVTVQLQLQGLHQAVEGVVQGQDRMGIMVREQPVVLQSPEEAQEVTVERPMLPVVQVLFLVVVGVEEEEQQQLTERVVPVQEGRFRLPTRLLQPLHHQQLPHHHSFAREVHQH